MLLLGVGAGVVMGRGVCRTKLCSIQQVRTMQKT